MTLTSVPGPARDATYSRRFQWLAFGLCLAGLLGHAGDAVRGIPVRWPSWAIGIILVTNGAVLLGVGRRWPRVVRAYWIGATAVALLGIVEAFAKP